MAKNVVKGNVIIGNNNSFGNVSNGVRHGNIVGGINLDDPKSILQKLKENPGLKIKVAGNHVTIKGSYKDKYGDICVSNNTIVDKSAALNCKEALRMFEGETKKAGGKNDLKNRMAEIINEDKPENPYAEAYQDSLKFGIVEYKTLEQNKKFAQIRTIVYSGLAVLSAVAAGVSFMAGHVETGAIFGAAALLQMAAGVMAYRNMRNADKEFKDVEDRLKETCDLYEQSKNPEREIGG